MRPATDDHTTAVIRTSLAAIAAAIAGYLLPFWYSALDLRTFLIPSSIGVTTAGFWVLGGLMLSVVAFLLAFMAVSLLSALSLSRAVPVAYSIASLLFCVRSIPSLQPIPSGPIPWYMYVWLCGPALLAAAGASLASMRSRAMPDRATEPSPPADTTAFSWRRVTVALVVTLAITAAALMVSPTLVTMWGRNTNVGPAAAFEGLALPLEREVRLTDEGFPPWVAITRPDGTITVQRHIKAEWPTDMYRQLIVHEYGHALLDDAITDGRYWSLTRKRRYERTTATTRWGRQLPPGVPEDLGVIFEVYRRTPADAYESRYWRGAMATHLTDNFGEFFAESFARWRAGEDVDPDVAAALSRLTQAR